MGAYGMTYILCRLRVLPAFIALCALLSIGSPRALAQSTYMLPGSEAWQPYLDQSPIEPESFADDPLGALSVLWPGGFMATLRTEIKSCAGLLMFLALAAVLSFLLAGTQGRGLFELAAAGGCGVLLWGGIIQLTQELSEKIESWKTFLLGFLPVYAGVLTAGGETAAAASAGGTLLTALCMLAQAIGAWLVPLLECYLALSIACSITAQPGLTAACDLTGKLMRKGLGIAGKIFVLLLGVQRVFTLQLDRSAQRLGRLLTGTIPIIGQSLSDASETVLAGVQMLKSGLGLAALGVLLAEFIPIYARLIMRCALLAGCGLFCEFSGIKRCKELFNCLLQAVQCMAAAAALFAGIAVFGTVLMFAVGTQ